jgi:hypothetical protein
MVWRIASAYVIKISASTFHKHIYFLCMQKIYSFILSHFYRDFYKRILMYLYQRMTQPFFAFTFHLLAPQKTNGEWRQLTFILLSNRRSDHSAIEEPKQAQAKQEEH